MGHLEGNFTPVLYIGHKVPKGYEAQQICIPPKLLSCMCVTECAKIQSGWAEQKQSTGFLLLKFTDKPY